MKDLGKKLMELPHAPEAQDKTPWAYTKGAFSLVMLSLGILGAGHEEHDARINVLEARIKKLEAALAEAMGPRGGLR